ncbi:uncharacterized protein LOC134469517 [Engraulis encrasicolus]|uniref:uncharacterized protein LOC134469517 n=1 Tax=Engraulis encrasicolus TaxID=184585 RepID=UPI002FD2BDA9
MLRMNLAICVQVVIFISTVTHTWAQKEAVADGGGGSGVGAECLGNILRITVPGPLLAGKRVDLAFRNGTDVVSVTPGLASQCGYTNSSDPWSNMLLYVSLQHCFAEPLMGIDWQAARVTHLHIRTSGGFPPSQEVLPVSPICPIPRRAAREVLCTQNFMEVSLEHDLMAAGVSGASSSKAGPGGASPFRLKEVIFYTPREQVFTPEQLYMNDYALDTSHSHLMIRGPLNVTTTYHQEVSGVPMVMMRASVVYQQRWMRSLVNTEAACPTGGVTFSASHVTWHLPRHIPPMMSPGAVVTEVWVGLEGKRMEQAAMQTRGYSLHTTQQHYVLEMPMQSPEGYFKSLIHRGRYHLTYSVEPMIELLWTDSGDAIQNQHKDSGDATHKESGDATQTRYKVLFPITSPPLPRPPQTTVDVDQATSMFNVAVGPFLHDVDLLKIRTSSGEMSVAEAIASGFDIQQLAIGNGAKVFVLRIPLSHPVAVKTTPNVKTEAYAAQLELVLVILPEGVTFTLPVALEAAVEDTDMATVSGSCDQRQFHVTVRYGSKGSNIETVIGRRVMTDQLAKEYGLRKNATHFNLVIPFDSADVANEAVTSGSVRARLDVSLRNPDVGMDITHFSTACTFPAHTIECDSNGNIAALAMKLDSVASLNPTQLTLNDPSCGPVYSDERLAFFYFTADTCGTTRQFEDGMMVYENIATVKNAQNDKAAATQSDKTTSEPKYRFKFSCVYMVNSSRTLAFSTAAQQSNVPMSSSSVGELRVQIRLAKDVSYSDFYSEGEYPVVRHLSQPLYFEVELLQFQNPDVELVVKDCWATLSGEHKSQPRWDLLVDGCPNPEDPEHVVFHPVRPDNRVMFPSLFKRFQAKMFSFAKHEDDPTGQVLFHCNVVICDRGAQQSGVCGGPCAGLQMSTQAGKRGSRAAPERQVMDVVSGLIILL